jgi:hypothetical protein
MNMYLLCFLKVQASQQPRSQSVGMYKNTCMFVLQDMFICIYMYIYVLQDMFVCIYMYVYVYMYLYTYVYMYICIFRSL